MRVSPLVYAVSILSWFGFSHFYIKSQHKSNEEDIKTGLNKKPKKCLTDTIEPANSKTMDKAPHCGVHSVDTVEMGERPSGAHGTSS